MKNLRNILWGLFVLLNVGMTFGQGGTPHFVNLTGQSDGNKIQLRWVVSDFETWKKGNVVGYTLERYTTHINNQRISADAMLNSGITLSSNLRPLSESEWESQFSNNNYADLAKGTLYALDDSIQISGPTTLADAVNTEESNASRFLFALFAAEQDFAVAQGMALGFTDMGVNPGEAYFYQLRLNDTSPQFENVINAFNIAVDDIPVLPAINGLQAEGMDQAIALEWNIISTEEYYSSYDLERSTDNVNFTKVNDLPFIFGADSNEDPQFAIYQDSIDSNTTIYYYRVKGRTAFGTQGPASDVVSATGVAPRLNMFLSIDDYDVQPNEIELTWNSFDGSFESQLQGFNVYRSKQSDVGFTKLNSGLIAASARSFMDTNPDNTAYYKLEAVDVNDHVYQSVAALVQPSDSIPPAIPSGLHAEFISERTLQLEWDENTEKDLKGYRVFIANGRDANYTQVTEYPLEEPKFVYEVDPEFDVDSIFFKVLATDKRDNYSEHSTICPLERPDMINPSSPVLLKATPTPSGIEIGFRFSSSEDVSFHLLERKPVGAPGWVTIVEIPKSEENLYLKDLTPDNITATCFVDSTILERREYEYRLLSYDDHKNGSSSETVTVRPYDSGMRGEVETISGSAECVAPDSISNDPQFAAIEEAIDMYYQDGVISDDMLDLLRLLNVITVQELQDLLQMTAYEIYVFLNQRKQDLWSDYLTAEVHLFWEYYNDEQLVDFQIYRSAEGSALMLYETIDADNLNLNNLVFEDKDVKPGYRYFYQVMARHMGNGYSKRSSTLMVKVPKF